MTGLPKATYISTHLGALDDRRDSKHRRNKKSDAALLHSVPAIALPRQLRRLTSARRVPILRRHRAPVAESVDAADSKSVFERSGSSSLPRGTTTWPARHWSCGLFHFCTNNPCNCCNPAVTALSQRLGRPRKTWLATYLAGVGNCAKVSVE